LVVGFNSSLVGVATIVGSNPAGVIGSDAGSLYMNGVGTAVT